MKTVIDSLGVYLPPRAVTTRDVALGCKRPLLFPLEQFTGIGSRRMAGDGEFSFELACKAVEDCLDVATIAAEDIDLVIGGTCSRMEGPDCHFAFEPSAAARVKERFGLSGALVFDVSNACAGLWTAVYAADALLCAGLARRALVFSGEYITHLTRTAQLEIGGAMDPRVPCLTLGDSGAALLLERREGEAGLQFLRLRTLGRYSDLCEAKPTSLPHGGAIMHTDMIKLGAAGVKEATAHTAAVLRAQEWSLDRVHHVIPHQTSRLNLADAVREFKAQFGADAALDGKMVDNLAERGNTATTATLLALWDRMRTGRIRNGECVLFGITGSGISVGTAVYKLDDLPERVRARHGESVAPTAPPPTRNRAGAAESNRRVPGGARIESIGIAPQGPLRRPTNELVIAAAQACLRSSRYRAEEIELLIHVGVHRAEFVIEPTVAAVAAGALGMNEAMERASGRSTFAFDLTNGATGFLNACQLVAALLGVGRIQTAMILASEYDNNLEVPGRPARDVLEVGTAVVLEPADASVAGFGAIEFNILERTTSLFSTHGAQESGKTFLRVHSSPGLEERMVQALENAARAVLEKESLTPNEIALVLPPQGRPQLAAGLADRLRIPVARFFAAELPRDAFTSSVPLALQSALERGLARPGDRVLVLTAGSGIQAGAATYRV